MIGAKLSHTWSYLAWVKVCAEMYVLLEGWVHDLLEEVGKNDCSIVISSLPLKVIIMSFPLYPHSQKGLF
jgi:hypothetical protein